MQRTPDILIRLSTFVGYFCIEKFILSWPVQAKSRRLLALACCVVSKGEIEYCARVGRLGWQAQHNPDGENRLLGLSAQPTTTVLVDSKYHVPDFFTALHCLMRLHHLRQRKSMRNRELRFASL